jgi:hypothetical protein
MICIDANKVYINLFTFIFPWLMQCNDVTSLSCEQSHLITCLHGWKINMDCMSAWLQQQINDIHLLADQTTTRAIKYMPEAEWLFDNYDKRNA